MDIEDLKFLLALLPADAGISSAGPLIRGGRTTWPGPEWVQYPITIKIPWDHVAQVESDFVAYLRAKGARRADH